MITQAEHFFKVHTISSLVLAKYLQSHIGKWEKTKSCDRSGYQFNPNKLDLITCCFSKIYQRTQ